jgi:hypothetical protein
MQIHDPLAGLDLSVKKHSQDFLPESPLIGYFVMCLIIFIFKKFYLRAFV